MEMFATAPVSSFAVYCLDSSQQTSRNSALSSKFDNSNEGLLFNDKHCTEIKMGINKTRKNTFRSTLFSFI